MVNHRKNFAEPGVLADAMDPHSSFRVRLEVNLTEWASRIRASLAAQLQRDENEVQNEETAPQIEEIPWWKALFKCLRCSGVYASQNSDAIQDFVALTPHDVCLHICQPDAEGSQPSWAVNTFSVDEESIKAVSRIFRLCRLNGNTTVEIIDSKITPMFYCDREGCQTLQFQQFSDAVCLYSCVF